MKKLLPVTLLALFLSCNAFAQEWISVNDSLPNTHRQVLTYVKLCYRFMKDLPRECHSFQYVTWYDGLNPPYEFNLHEIRDHNYGTEQVVEVTHWQPLPPKPEEK